MDDRWLAWRAKRSYPTTSRAMWFDAPLPVPPRPPRPPAPSLARRATPRSPAPDPLAARVTEGTPDDQGQLEDRVHQRRDRLPGTQFVAQVQPAPVGHRALDDEGRAGHRPDEIDDRRYPGRPGARRRRRRPV